MIIINIINIIIIIVIVIVVHSMKKADHRRSPQVMFYATGLGHQDTDKFEPFLDIYVKKKTYWKMRTLESLLKEMNHSEVSIRCCVNVLSVCEFIF